MSEKFDLGDDLSWYVDNDKVVRCGDCDRPIKHCRCEIEDFQNPIGDPCTRCDSTLTDKLDVIWEDETLTCWNNQCYRCGETFETVKPKEAR